MPQHKENDHKRDLKLEYAAENNESLDEEFLEDLTMSTYLQLQIV